MKIALFLALLSWKSVCAQPGASALASPLLPVEKKIYYALGDKQIPIRILQYGPVKDIVYINLHDNEFTSVAAAQSILATSGGMLIKLDNAQQRLIRFRLQGKNFAVDPNRIFSREGIIQSLKLHGKAHPKAVIEIEKFARRLLYLIPETTSCIIALHNNTDGAFSVDSYLPGNDRQVDARAVFRDSLQDIDDLAFTTDSLLYQHMANEHYNTVWQDNKRATRDGSLSVYCGEQKRRYINIETENGKFNQHREMLEKLNSILARIDYATRTK